MKIQTLLFTTMTAWLPWTHHTLHVLFILVAYRFYERQKRLNFQQLLRQIFTRQSFFMLLFFCWLQFLGDTMVDYLPVLIYTVTILLDIQEEQNLISTAEKDKDVKDSFCFLLNNVQLYVLAYNILSAILSYSWPQTLKTLILMYMLKMKYGFNPYMQKMFSNTHDAILLALNGKDILLRIYIVFYRVLCSFAKVYLSGQKRVTLIKKSN